MKVKVHFTQTSEYVAELEYDELAGLVKQDNEEYECEIILPLEKELASKFGHEVNKDAGPELAEAIDTQGYEVDSYISYITGFEPVG